MVPRHAVESLNQVRVIAEVGDEDQHGSESSSYPPVIFRPPLDHVAGLGARVCRDPDDDQILAIAITGSAGALVTGAADLLVLGAQGSVNITSVADFEVLARG